MVVMKVVVVKMVEKEVKEEVKEEVEMMEEYVVVGMEVVAMVGENHKFSTSQICNHSQRIHHLQDTSLDRWQD
tara:strand:- start:139 stop:357 length:219 start_codon:yes stop_codon:yes gene_type:complete